MAGEAQFTRKVFIELPDGTLFHPTGYNYFFLPGDKIIGPDGHERSVFPPRRRSKLERFVRALFS